jgi:hypothetical protein
MYAILATIVEGGQAIILINIETVKINKLLVQFILILNPLKSTLEANPFRRGAWGWGQLNQQNHASLGGTLCNISKT